MIRLIPLLLALTVVSGFVGATCPTSVKCPLHSNMTGVLDHTEYPEGKAVGVYKCVRGHKFSLVC